MDSQHGYLLFHSAGEMEASVLVSGWWERPLLEILIESGAYGGFGNMVDDACGGFLKWCFSQPECPLGLFSLQSLPGLPFRGAEFDRWAWYDTLMAEVTEWEDPPVLVDLDNFQITHRGEVLWPPPDRRRPRRREPQALPGEPFAVGWYGATSLGGLRPDTGTYTYYTPSEVPPITIRLNGAFDWLQAASAKRPMASTEGVTGCLDRLLTSGVEGLPDEFVRFFRKSELWRKVRSCTDCYFNVDTAAVEIPGGLGRLIRFMSDSQDCKHWHLHLAPCGTKHAVAATYHFRGSDPEHPQGGKPHPRDITVCANSFEEFMYRFWLENELFYAAYEKTELPPGGADYLAFYQTTAS